MTKGKICRGISSILFDRLKSKKIQKNNTISLHSKMMNIVPHTKINKKINKDKEPSKIHKTMIIKAIKRILTNSKEKIAKCEIGCQANYDIYNQIIAPQIINLTPKIDLFQCQ